MYCVGTHPTQGVGYFTVLCIFFAKIPRDPGPRSQTKQISDPLLKVVLSYSEHGIVRESQPCNKGR